MIHHLLGTRVPRNCQEGHDSQVGKEESCGQWATNPFGIRKMFQGLCVLAGNVTSPVVFRLHALHTR
jgi:hypothetical protein